jgi:glycosyltransferase involved in cell wall biosynthesis
LPRCVFVIVGDGELRPALERRASELGLDGRVRFLGWRGDLDTVYAASDLFVLTSRNEGTPVALIEAMAAGLASVSTDVGGVRDVVADAEVGVLVPFGDVDALAAAVLALAEAPARRSGMGRAARASVRDRFHAARLVADIRALYRGLVGADT